MFGWLGIVLYCKITNYNGEHSECPKMMQKAVLEWMAKKPWQDDVTLAGSKRLEMEEYHHEIFSWQICLSIKGNMWFDTFQKVIIVQQLSTWGGGVVGIRPQNHFNTIPNGVFRVNLHLSKLCFQESNYTLQNCVFGVFFTLTIERHKTFNLWSYCTQVIPSTPGPCALWGVSKKLKDS